jgi:hypothetical protein
MSADGQGGQGGPYGGPYGPPPQLYTPQPYAPQPYRPPYPQYAQYVQQYAQQPSMRAAEADRERAADVLKAGYAEGRLRKEEFDHRLTRVHEARTYGELHQIVADLPQGPSPVPAPQPYPVPHQPYYPGAYRVQPTNGTATAAMICGILTPFTWGLTSLPAVILGHKARAEIRRGGERGDGYAVTGLVIGYLGIAGWLILLMGIVPFATSD